MKCGYIQPESMQYPHFIFTPRPRRWNRQRVPKRRQNSNGRRGYTQKNAYNHKVTYIARRISIPDGIIHSLNFSTAPIMHRRMLSDVCTVRKNFCLQISKH